MEVMTEAEVSMVLDTFMYLDYEGAEDGQSIREIMEDISKDEEFVAVRFNEYAVLSKACENPQIGELTICCQSKDMGYNEGTRAAAFVNEDTDTTYISFRGTYDGEWLDNGKGLTSISTPQQEEALEYFEEVVETMGLSEKDTVYLGAHSKGGNKVQFITMETKYPDVIDRTYSCDGQGQSKKAIEHWKEKYSKEEYEERTFKIYGINGQNDFVHVLGNSIIPVSHICYVKTPSEKFDFVGYHDITRMFATEKKDENGKIYYEYNGRKNENALRRGELSDYVDSLSKDVLLFPDNVADGSCATLMQFAEIVNGGRITGINGESGNLLDLVEFRFAGVAAIIASLIQKKGREFIDVVLNGEAFSQRLPEDSSLEADYGLMEETALYLEEICRKSEELLYEIDRNSILLPFLFEGYSFRRHHVENCVAKIRTNNEKMVRAAKIIRRVATLYRNFDNQ